jgi:hypothetical protein
MTDVAITIAPAKRRGRFVSGAFAVAIALALIAGAWHLAGAGDGTLALSLLLGAGFGLLLQRSRFCFFCVTRDFLDDRDARGLLGIVAALAVGTLGYHLVFGLFVPDPGSGRLPPDAHIGPVSWVLALAALVFGAGMALSGSCISAHLYRLGEGAVASIIALVGVLIGFGVGFLSWNHLYLAGIDQAPVLWLPAYLGYGGSIVVQLVGLGGLAIVLMIGHRRREPAESMDLPSHHGGFRQRLLENRWPTYVGGLLIGALAVGAYLRVAPLGVTAELGSIARTFGDQADLIPTRLQGLDGFSGCATAIKAGLLSTNGAFIGGLVMASLAAALMAGNFSLQPAPIGKGARHLLGGVLMGWGAMTALGCTVGTLLSGIMAAALSGWVFALFCLLGLWATWRVMGCFSRS